ncbi:uncharacterized protein Bfra_007714 [Botrytis fragariae]|uniref:Uncharacterized protein n=1 Tax=Botrytis fragariae TaxID=1964551 RepID=A0A8H6EGE9_9HELO|nr:uncharacterized protein Bfra_007714 [Botrytis fragariae]KAF5871201.1 hypothetical protein Bfra_007714 [Botrytis fragariae]
MCGTSFEYVSGWRQKRCHQNYIAIYESKLSASKAALEVIGLRVARGLLPVSPMKHSVHVVGGVSVNWQYGERWARVKNCQAC